ncbi:MAG: heme-dependent oxidative N-demethylase subunit alpha family protein, partial [Bdellovibrionales bacterium]
MAPMNIPGVTIDPSRIDHNLVATLRTDGMTRFPPLPKTMMTQMRKDEPWLIVDNTYPAQIAERLRMLQEKPDWVIARTNARGVRAMEEELRDTVVTSLLETYPEYFELDGATLWSKLTGIGVDTSRTGADPMVACLLLASEDMTIMAPRVRSGQRVYPLVSGTLAFPNNWSLVPNYDEPRPADVPGNEGAIKEWEQRSYISKLGARLGKTPRQIHYRHVPHYMKKFADHVDRF